MFPLCVPFEKIRCSPPQLRDRYEGGAAMNEQILGEIADFCRQTGLAESTFGRRAVNDGKLATRLRNGGRITTDTLDRIRTFMTDNRSSAPGRGREFAQGSIGGGAVAAALAAP